MADNCIYNPARNKFGYSQEVWNRIKDALGDKVPTRGKFTNVVRNLGVDDTRMVNVKGEDGKRFFGKNITDVSDIDFSKPIANNVLVRLASKNGEKFFVSNKNDVTSKPSRWVIDEHSGRTAPNPDWDAINPNVTSMKKYVRDESDPNMWREAGPDDDGGAFLNIQNPSKQRYTTDKVVERGIDAFEVNGKYMLIDETSQAIKPSKIETKVVRDTMEQTNVTKTPDVNDVTRMLGEYNIPRGVAGAVAGGVVGNYADSNDEFAGTFWGGALGIMLGTPKVRTKFKGVYNKATGQSGDPYQQYAETLSKKEKQHMLLEDAKLQGYIGDVTDMDQVEKFMRGKTALNSEKANGSFSMQWFFNNEYFRSGEGLLKDMGSETGKRLFNVLRGFQSKPVSMYARFGDIQTRIFGDVNTKQTFKDAQTNFIRNFTGGSKISEKDAMDSFGSAVKRIITYGAKIDEQGNFTFTKSAPANKLYNDPDIRAMDEAILRDPQASKVYDATKQYFDAEGKRALQIIDDQLTKEIDQAIFTPNIQALLKEIQNSGMTFKQFSRANPSKKKTIDSFLKGGDKDIKSVRKDTADRIKALIEDKKRFQDLQGNYIPQKFSRAKEVIQRKQWEKNNAGRLSDKPVKDVDQLWEQHKADLILDQNKEKFTAFEINEDGMDFNKRKFESRLKARVFVKNTASLLPETDQYKGQLLRSIEEKPDNFIVEVPDGNGGVNFEVTTPETWRELYPKGIYENANRDIVDRANRAYVSTNLSMNADHFDRPRNMDIPTEFLATDLEALVKFYSDDMGMRLHSIENGMYDASATRKNWIRPIREEIKDTFTDKQVMNTRLNEVESWISLMQGQRAERKVGMTPADRERMKTKAINDAKNDSFMNSISKVATASFNYGTTLYSMFTPLVFGPFLSSFKHIGGEYMKGFLHPVDYAKTLKRVTDEIEKMGVIQKKFEAYAPEHKRQFREDLLGDTSSWRRRFADVSDGMTNFTAELSIARMLKVDPENLGIARLAVGNMLDISGAEAGMVTMAVFRHVEDLIDGAKRLEGQDVVTINGTRYSKKGLYEEFGRLGITDPISFIKKEKQFKSFTGYLEGNVDFKKIDSDFYGQMSEITNTIIDQYHGRTKLSRPLKWMDNVWGRALSRYSVYAQNFGVQTTANRIYRPLKDWSEKYKMEDESMPFFKLVLAASMRRDEVFKKQFGDSWEQAYNEFPMEAINSFYKVFGALGVANAMMITRGGILDVTSIATNEALGNDDYEAWKNIDKYLALGQRADTGENFYLNDIFSGDVQGLDLYRAFTHQLGMVSRTGFGGRYSQIFTEDLRYTQGGIAEMTPVTGLLNDVFETSGTAFNLFRDGDFGEIPDTIARESLDFLLLRGTPFGTFTSSNTAMKNFILQKPENRNIQYRLPSGEEIDLTSYSP